MNVLAFDVSTGGISAALFDSGLNSVQTVEHSWEISQSVSGAATLTIENILDHFRSVSLALRLSEQTIDAVSLACFMHNCVLLDGNGEPLSPVFTWLDSRGETGMEYIRSRMGGRFHDRTGCRYHPMFPVFKIATLHLEDDEAIRRAHRVVSVKAYLLERLTGVWGEDYGMASASGLFNIVEGHWDPALMVLLGLSFSQLPRVHDRNDVAGHVSHRAFLEFGIPEGTPVVYGSGDGFLANVGTGCESPERMTITLGTSAAVRQTLARPALDPDSGTFCYKADRSAFLLGCAGNNGGNVLDWARSLFGSLAAVPPSTDLPQFIPLLYGERSPEWNPNLTASWHGLTSRHRLPELARSVLEGVLFNLAYFVEILEQTSDEHADEIVLSGNGFRETEAPRILASILTAKVWIPSAPGLASLRGAAICAVRGLEHPEPALAVMEVPAAGEPELAERYRKYKQLRSTEGARYFPSL